MRKILMLGGAYSQIPAIKRARELGYYVITCDYLPANPGHVFADEYAEISTTDKEAVLRFAREKDIDGIIAYASDPSAATAAYICDAMQLSGADYESVRLLSEKDLFRRFQKENGFCAPDFIVLTKPEELADAISKIKYPCMVKPVDSSGSKGVRRIETQTGLQQAVAGAFPFSRCGRVIVEECIESPYNQLHGDGVVVDGKLLFVALGEQRFKHSAPIGTSFPARLDQSLMGDVYTEVSRVVERSGFLCGGINIEVRVTEQREIYIIEIGPRTGGNYVPQIMELATGGDEVDAVLQIAMGEPCTVKPVEHVQCCFQYIIGSDVSGPFREIFFDEYIRDKVACTYIHKQKGEPVGEYENSSGVVGVALLKFKDPEEMENDIKNIKQHIKVLVEE